MKTHLYHLPNPHNPTTTTNTAAATTTTVTVFSQKEVGVVGVDRPPLPLRETECRDCHLLLRGLALTLICPDR